MLVRRKVSRDCFITQPRKIWIDGLLDVIVLDYDGGLSVIGLEDDYRHHAQVPRLYVRRQWVESMVNATNNSEPPDSELHDPYHSYFEYYYDDQQHGKQHLIRGESGNLLSQDSQHNAAVNARRRLEEIIEPKGEEGNPHDDEHIGALVDDIGIPEEEEAPFDDDPNGHLDATHGQEDIGAHLEDTVDDMAADQYHYDDYPMYDDGYGRYRGDDM